jgi:hypothetical protein
VPTSKAKVEINNINKRKKKKRKEIEGNITHSNTLSKKKVG